jgi:predicted regulator of Ras-like GTPase activity (Roadblock/LC7/MglB family)
VRRAPVVVALVLAASATVGLGVLLLHSEGLALLAHGSVVAISLAVAFILAIGGFFVGVLYKMHAAEDLDEKPSLEKLSAALSLERRLRTEASRERYRLRQNVLALEGQIRTLNAKPLPPAELAETPLDDADLLPGAPEPAHNPTELEGLAATCERLRLELRQRKERMADLEAELSVAQAEAADLRTRSGRQQAAPAAVFKGESLTAVLDGIVAQEGVRVALVADDAGLVVDKAGEALEPDALAAVSGVVAELSPRVTDLLPLGEIATVALGDTSGRVMEVRYFMLLGSRCALVVIRDEGASAAEPVRRAVEAIAERLAE